MDAARAAALFARTPSLTAEHLRALVAATGSLENAASIGKQIVPGVELPTEAQAFLAAPDEAAIDADLAWIEASGAQLVTAVSAQYPQLLAQISRGPAVLYVLGDVSALAMPQLAMVGSRNPTAAYAAFVAAARETVEDHELEQALEFYGWAEDVAGKSGTSRRRSRTADAL